MHRLNNLEQWRTDMWCVIMWIKWSFFCSCEQICLQRCFFFFYSSPTWSCASTVSSCVLTPKLTNETVGWKRCGPTSQPKVPGIEIEIEISSTFLFYIFLTYWESHFLSFLPREFKKIVHVVLELHESKPENNTTGRHDFLDFVRHRSAFKRITSTQLSGKN